MTFRILMGIDHYPPLLGGSQLQTQLLSRQLAKRGHVVSVVTTKQLGLPEEESDFGVTVHRINGLTTRIPWFFKDPTRRRPPPFPDPGMVWHLQQLIEREQPHVVQACGWIANSFAAALVNKHIPLVVTVRNYFHSCATGILMRHGQICDGPAFVKCLECATHFYGGLKAFAAVAGVQGSRSLLMRKTTVFHCISNYIERVLRRDLLSFQENDRRRDDGRANTILIHDLFAEPENGVPDSSYLSRLPAEPFMLFVGALSPHKGLIVLLEAYDRLVMPPPLVLIGTVEHNTPKSFPVGVMVIQDVPHSTVMSAWARCLFGIVPSMWPDSFPNVVLEGMSRAKAVIGSDAGGIPDMIVDGETGLLVPICDVEALTNALQKMIENETLREKYGQAGRERVKEKFAPDIVLPQFESLYHQLAEEYGMYTEFQREQR